MNLEGYAGAVEPGPAVLAPGLGAGAWATGGPRTPGPVPLQP